MPIACDCEIQIHSRGRNKLFLHNMPKKKFITSRPKTLVKRERITERSRNQPVLEFLNCYWGKCRINVGKETDTYTGNSLKVRLYQRFLVAYARRDEHDKRESRPGGDTTAGPNSCCKVLSYGTRFPSS